MDSWLEGLPLKFSTKDLREQIEIILAVIDAGKDTSLSTLYSYPENESVLKKILIALLASARRLPQEDMTDRIKEVLLKFTHSQENKKVLSRVLNQMDDDAKIRLSFLNLA